MLTADESEQARRYFDLLLQELHRLGVTSSSPGFSTLWTAINNLLSDVSPFTPDENILLKEEVCSSVIPEVQPESQPLGCELSDSVSEVKIESEEYVETQIDPQSDTLIIPAEQLLRSIKEEDTMGWMTNHDLPVDVVSSEDGVWSVKPPERDAFEGIITSDWEGNTQYGCPFYPCTLAYTTVDELMTHCILHQNNPDFSCSWLDCREVFSSSDIGSIAQHTMTHLGGNSSEFEAFSLQSAAKNSSTFSEKVDSEHQDTILMDGRPVKSDLCTCDCAQCRCRSKTRNCSGDTPFQCSWEGCKKTFVNKDDLIIHARVHDGERPFRCSWDGCKKTFKNSGNLNVHARVHTGERPFKCSWKGCKKAFIKSSYLTFHTRIHTGERPFKCSWIGCNKTFIRKSKLNVHTRIHTGERPYICSWTCCNKTFTNSSQLLIHTRVHTGEKPFMCSWNGCQKTFSQKSGLTLHTRVHTRERPFQCSWSGCEEAFAQEGHLTIHERTHAGE